MIFWRQSRIINSDIPEIFGIVNKNYEQSMGIGVLGLVDWWDEIFLCRDVVKHSEQWKFVSSWICTPLAISSFFLLFFSLCQPGRKRAAYLKFGNLNCNLNRFLCKIIIIFHCPYACNMALVKNNIWPLRKYASGNFFTSYRSWALLHKYTPTLSK